MSVFPQINIKFSFVLRGCRVVSIWVLFWSTTGLLCLDTCCSVTGSVALSLCFGLTEVTLSVCLRLSLTNALTVGKSWPVLGLVRQIPPCDARRQIPYVSDDSGVNVRFLPWRTHTTHTHILTPKPQCQICLPVLCSGLVAQSGSTQLPVFSGCSAQSENRCYDHRHPTC